MGKFRTRLRPDEAHHLGLEYRTPEKGRNTLRYSLDKDQVEQLLHYNKHVKPKQESANNKSEEHSTHVDDKKGTIKSTITTEFEPKNHTDLAKAHKVDLKIYAITNYWSKKLPNGKYTSSIFCTKRKSADVTPEEILGILKNYKSDYKPITAKDLLKNDEVIAYKSCAFFDLTDFHLDKKDIYNTSIETKVQNYHDMVDKLAKKAFMYSYLEEAVLIVGSDMLHTDNLMNATTRLTPQDISVSWDEAFRLGFDIYVTTIQKLKQFCQTLHVILVQGNHARSKEYYLAFALERYFEKDPNIVFDTTPAPRKVFIYGETFIGLHHGDTKIADLPIVFAKEFSEKWGLCKYHEIKVGDKHHYMEKDYHGVRIKQLPALSNPDTWHNQQNYVNSVQSAIVSIYDHNKGRSIDIEERL